MPKYIANEKVWIGHLNRHVEEGEEFETEFPKGFKPSGRIELVKPKKNSQPQKPKSDPGIKDPDNLDGEEDPDGDEHPDGDEQQTEG